MDSMWRLGYEFAATFVTFVCISYFALQIWVNLTREKFLVLGEKKLTKFVYFLETAIYESSIFQINMIVYINLVVNSANSAFLIRSYAKETPLRWSKTWLDDHITVRRINMLYLNLTMNMVSTNCGCIILNNCFWKTLNRKWKWKCY